MEWSEIKNVCPICGEKSEHKHNYEYMDGKIDEIYIRRCRKKNKKGEYNCPFLHVYHKTIKKGERMLKFEDAIKNARS